jgi:phospholipid/cholesterol/gamma-HCH transport system substrate-binding protein
VAGLSAVGEQHLDLRPRGTSGPYLTDGSVIEQRNTSTPKPFAELLAHVGSISDQLDPKQLGVIVDELATATDGGAADVRRMLEGGRLLLTGLEDVLPETTRLLENGHTTLTTVADLNDELARFGKAGRTVGATLKKSDSEIRKLLDRSPEALALLTDVITETGPTLGALTGDLNRVTKLVVERLPAFSQYLPSLTQLGNALPEVTRGGTLTALTDLYPRDMCEYDTPRRSPTIGGKPDPRLDAYCPTRGPELQQRGAYNAPRPAGDDTAGPAGRSSSGSGTSAPSTSRSTTSGQTALPQSGAANWYDSYLRWLLTS